MYERFYGLKESPFNVTSDPHFLYLSGKHKEALSLLRYGVEQRKGFIEITGDIGTGKTTLCRALLNELSSTTKTAFILNPKLPVLQFLRVIMEDFGILLPKRNKVEMIKGLNAFLLDQLSRGHNVVLIIDEAQNLDNKMLEEIRLLSNLETVQEKLIQIILVGQPELRDKLALPDIAQLRQRIAIRYHIRPLERNEVGEYIKHRLTVAGSNGSILFTEDAIGFIYSYSKGVPRLINVVCDRALLLGYVREMTIFDGEMIKRATREIEGVVV